MTDRVPFTPVSDVPGLSNFEGEVVTRYVSNEATDWLTRLDNALKAQSTDLLYRQRNRVYRIDDPLNPGEAICVKAFKTPDPVRSAYYRRTGSKARRAHQYSRHLYEHGAAVTEPLGYLERWEGNRLVESYLFTRYLANSTDLYSEMTYLLRERPFAADYVRLLRVCAVAVRGMHDSGFIHGDLGPQNLLLTREGDADWANPTFIDLNRGKLQPNPTLKQRARDLERMKIPSHFLQIFRHIYWNDSPIPAEFERWANRYRARFRAHQRSRKLRHPIRTLKQWLKPPPADLKKAVSTGQPSERDVWLWDEHSAQPSVMLNSKDRKQWRNRKDTWTLLLANLRQLKSIRKHYKQRKATAYTTPVRPGNRLGVCVEVDATFEAQLKQLQQTPGIPVFVRVYYHLGEQRLPRVYAAINALADAGHEVSIGLVQSRQALLNPEGWNNFVQATVNTLAKRLHCVEVGHAVNRVKWGLWTLADINALQAPVAALKQQHPHLTFLGPAVNDFEFQYYPPLLDATPTAFDAVSCHLYVDRRGAPENYQGRFSTLEKCLYGQAIADTYHKQGFYITEVNWPLKNTGLYSPVAGAYQHHESVENALHVSEADSAAYMVRYALIALCSGTTERIWWWRLAHPGFGLIDTLNGWRERPGWPALVQFHQAMSDETFRGREEKDGAIWWHFDRVSLVYSLSGSQVTLSDDITQVTDLSGKTQAVKPGDKIDLNGNPVYLHKGSAK